MFARSPRTPSYRLHKPSGQAVVTINGQDVYLGKFNSPESRAEYDRVIAEWLGNGRQSLVTSDVTINEVILRFLKHVDILYESNEPKNFRLALRPLRELYGRPLTGSSGR